MTSYTSCRLRSSSQTNVPLLIQKQQYHLTLWLHLAQCHPTTSVPKVNKTKFWNWSMLCALSVRWQHMQVWGSGGWMMWVHVTDQSTDPSTDPLTTPFSHAKKTPGHRLAPNVGLSCSVLSYRNIVTEYSHYSLFSLERFTCVNVLDSTGQM